VNLDLAALNNRKRPAGEAGRFWGYYREERYMYLYICGSVGGRWALDVPRAESMGVECAIWAARDPTKKFSLLLDRPLSCNP
jgi:hypothetical protein